VVAHPSPVPADVQRVADALSEDDWQRLTVQLGRYALQRSRRFYWRTGSTGELPYGEVTESLVSKAFILWLTGRRRWNRTEYPDLQGFLMGVIDSLLSHAAAGSDNRSLASDAGQIAVLHSTPESDLLDRERSDAADRLIAELVTQTKDDAIAGQIIDAMRNGAATRRDIVTATGRTSEEIDNGLKRLRRAGARIVNERKASGI
jgi:hypothetical protein